jgi:hypothetical protein
MRRMRPKCGCLGEGIEKKERGYFVGLPRPPGGMFSQPAGLTAVQPLTKSYIAAGAAAAFFARFLRCDFFAPLRFVFLAAPRAPVLRTVRFFPFFALRLCFFAVIGM